MGRSITTHSPPHEAWARAELERRGWSGDDLEGVLLEFSEDVRQFPGHPDFSLLIAQCVHRNRQREASDG